ncbi:MAG: S8 family serine peptidase [Proteobacteria bacterium]|nr:S8 family serine peptidase [Pseudomonadota bacterium]
MKKLLLSGLMVLSTAQAATIAVIDSGLDVEHEQIVPNLWVNSAPMALTLFKDVLHGWNFVDNNNQVIDRKLFTYFASSEADIKKYYEILAKQYLFQTTDEDRTWAMQMQRTPGFIPKVRSYGTFMHGTHVAGISVKGSENKAMGILLLKTNVQAEIQAAQAHKQDQVTESPWVKIDPLIDSVASGQMRSMVTIGQFVHLHKADVDNGSFGTGYTQALNFADYAFVNLIGRIPTEEEKKQTAIKLVKAMSEKAVDFVGAAPKTLFVFAAGSDGLNNDEFGTSPANVKADNSMSVAATFEDQFLAPFSNWGTATVDLAAPGMLIRSAVPGIGSLPVSGTSQAAPFVANVAGQVKDANPALTPKEIKEILMGTVDKKSFLKIRVKSGGLVNKDRAVLAADLSRKMSLAEAIAISLERMPMLVEATSDLVGEKSLQSMLGEIKPVEMPSMLEF